MARFGAARRPIRFAALLAVVAAIAATPATAKLVQFQTPSRNIGCIGDTAASANTVRCDIRTRSWSPPPRPKACRLDWGQGLSLDAAGRARFVCAGDTALNSGRRLAYGTAIRIGAIVCRSRVTGLTCRNAAGHGFTLSRLRARRF